MPEKLFIKTLSLRKISNDCFEGITPIKVSNSASIYFLIYNIIGFQELFCNSTNSFGLSAR